MSDTALTESSIGNYDHFIELGNKSMDMSRAFKLTIKKFNIKAVDVARISGVAESDVSRFLGGKANSGYKKVDKLINTLPPTAKDYFWLVYKSGDSVFLSSDTQPENDLSVCEKGGNYKVRTQPKKAIAC